MSQVPFRIFYSLALLAAVLFVAPSCKVFDDDAAGPSVPFVCDTIAPTIFVHGALGAGDTWAKQVQRFQSNPVCNPRFYAFDWNSIDQDDEPDVQALDLFVASVLQETGASKVNLVAHSAGGRLCYQFLDDGLRASRVNRYAHVGSFREDTLPGFGTEIIPTVNIWSPDDQVIDDQGAIPGATNVSIGGKDHYQIATAPETFEAIYRHFTEGIPPAELEPIRTIEITVSGRALSLGDNIPEEGATVEVYELETLRGQRITSPIATFPIDASGNWGPIPLNPGVFYEFYLQPADTSARPIHYYREPFSSSNPLVYLRTLPPPSSPAGLLLSALPSDDNQSVVAVFSASQAVINGRDELSANDVELATPELAAADQTSIAFFLYDDGDQSTSGNPHPIFNLAPFLVGADIFFPTEPPATIELDFNGRQLRMPSWKSDTEGISVAVFD